MPYKAFLEKYHDQKINIRRNYRNALLCDG